MTDRRLVTLGAKVELARRNFFDYCALKAPDFYKTDRQFLVSLCDEMQDFMTSDKKVLIINIPPRHGKSRTAGLFCEWCLGKNSELKIMTGSYNETLSTMFSKNVRGSISEVKADLYKPVFADVFPNVRIKRGDGAMNLWSLDGGYNNYLATSPGGTATGFGATLLIIDDLIKNAEEANNALTKQKQWEWFTNTMLSRLETGGKIIVIMTRWATDDLAGRLLKEYNNNDIKHISLSACNNGKMLCDEILTKEEYENKKHLISPEIVAANYDQQPIDLKGQLYSKFKTYDSLPTNDKGQSLIYEILSYTDTADTGSDYLCSIVFGIYNKEAYVLDVIYTKEPMEVTEIAVAKQFECNKVNRARIESNNGGRGFARAVQGRMKTNYTIISTFSQTKNKQTRILTQSAWVQEHIYFPCGWHNRWEEFYNSLAHYQREGKNLHDDAEDALTGVAETIQLLWR
jgi:predicted phage terminase large subunit-like protein